MIRGRESRRLKVRDEPPRPRGELTGLPLSFQGCLLVAFRATVNTRAWGTYVRDWRVEVHFRELWYMDLSLGSETVRLNEAEVRGPKSR